MTELTFNECVRVTQQMISLNLGSNAFQKQIEERLLLLFPHDISAPHLVALCKATSRHRFQDSALLNKLQDIATNYAKELSNQQVLEVLWSFSRGKRGSVPLFNALEREVLLRISMYNLRALAFIMEGFSLVNYQSDLLVEALQDRFKVLALENSQINPHYLLKIVMALNNLHLTSSSFFASILDSLTDSELSADQFIRLCHSIAKCEQSEFNDIFIQLLEKGERHIQSIVESQDVQSVSMLLFCFAQSNYTYNLDSVVSALGPVHQVPKHLFTDCFYALLSLKQFQRACEFLPIVK